MVNPNFVIVGVIIQTLGSIGYFLDTIKGKIKPNRVSWLLWSIAPMLAFFAMLSQGVGIQSLTTFIVGFIPLIIFVASFVNKNAEWKLGKVDFACGILSILGLIMWWVTKVGNIAIVFGILADGLAAIPTIIKSWSQPESENDMIFITGVVNAVIGVLALQRWNFEDYAFPIYLVFINLILVLLIKFKLGKKI